MNGSNIQSRDWFKVIEMLQQNWALTDPKSDGRVTVYFIGDTSGVFDQLDFPDAEAAADALQRNGFRRLADDARAPMVVFTRASSVPVPTTSPTIAPFATWCAATATGASLSL